MQLASTPDFTIESIKRMEDMSFFTHAQIFDDLLIISQKETNCFVWKTDEGLVVIDAIWPSEKVYDYLIHAIGAIGWNPDDIYKLVLTHGNVDHTGCGKWIVSHHNATTYLSKIDDEFWQEHPTKPNRPDTWKDFSIDEYMKDGDVISCGDKSMYVYATPGHTPGCLSYIFPVYDNGERHMAALFGGATPPWNSEEGTRQYRNSLHYFMKVAKENGVDVALCNHTAFDNGIERINYSIKRRSYMPNIYVLGQKGFDDFCRVFETLAQNNLLKLGSNNQ